MGTIKQCKDTRLLQVPPPLLCNHLFCTILFIENACTLVELDIQELIFVTHIVVCTFEQWDYPQFRPLKIYFEGHHWFWNRLFFHHFDLLSCLGFDGGIILFFYDHDILSCVLKHRATLGLNDIGQLSWCVTKELMCFCSLSNIGIQMKEHFESQVLMDKRENK
jgi:hypothetical protein